MTRRPPVRPLSINAERDGRDHGPDSFPPRDDKQPSTQRSTPIGRQNDERGERSVCRSALKPGGGEEEKPFENSLRGRQRHGHVRSTTDVCDTCF